MGLVRYFFSPEIGRSLHEMARPVAALRAWRWGPAEERVPFRLAWKGLSAGEKLLVAAGLLLVAACGVVGAAILGFQAADAQAQGIAPSLFAAPDEKTQELLGFISNLDKARASVPTVNAMFGAFNMWMLALGMYLLIYYTVTKTVDTGARGRFAFGKWEIIRIVTAVALMAPILSGMNGLQYMVIGLGKMAGGFANAVWEPFSEAALGDGKIEVPDPSERAWRAAIAGTLVLEVCREAANRDGGRCRGCRLRRGQRDPGEEVGLAGG